MIMQDDPEPWSVVGANEPGLTVTGRPRDPNSHTMQSDFLAPNTGLVVLGLFVFFFVFILKELHSLLGIIGKM